MPRTTSTLLLSLAALAVVLAACSAARDTRSADADAAAAGCDASKVDYLIGENVSGYIERKAMKESGAEDVRVLKPDSVVTMDFNARRLNIHTDPGKVIIKLACG